MIDKLGAIEKLQPSFFGTDHKSPSEKNEQYLPSVNYYPKRIGKLVGVALGVALLGYCEAPPAGEAAHNSIVVQPEICQKDCLEQSTTTSTSSASRPIMPLPKIVMPPRPKHSVDSPPTAASRLPTAAKPLITPTSIAIAKAASVGVTSVQPNQGIDISWPESNCSNGIPKGIQFAVIGINGGKNFTSNSCLASEITKLQQAGVNQLDLYANADYQSGPAMETYKDSRLPKYKSCSDNDLNCIAYNYGYSAGKFAADFANKNHVTSNRWWLDVETGNSWDGNNPGHAVSENINSLKGEMDAIEKYAGSATKTPVAIGFYSVPNSMWTAITGNWQPPDMRTPQDTKRFAQSWVARGAGSEAEAISYCHNSDFTGGGTAFVQFMTDDIVDRDVAC